MKYTEIQRPNAAERMRRHRKRRQKGLRHIGLEIKELEVDSLIRDGFLRPDQRDDVSEVKRALYRFFDLTLGAR